MAVEQSPPVCARPTLGNCMRPIVAVGSVVLAMVLVTLGARPAAAYPQWQFSSDTIRCSQCHYAPAGGGLITGYGRDAIADELSTFEGDGEFAHGIIDLPSAIKLGFDGRLAALSHDVGEVQGPHTAYFPMQADLIVRIGLGDSLSVMATGGYRGQARTGDQPLGEGGAEPAAGSRFISREHYVLWRPSPQGIYARAGRFFAPYGLRLAEHYTYVRRDTGFNLLEETYSASVGWVNNEWELHLTAFGPDFLRQTGSNEQGGAGMFELRVGEASSFGVQGRAGLQTDVNRFMGGGFYKTWFEDLSLLFQGEVDVIHAIFPGDTGSTQSLIAYLGLTYFPTQGVWITPFAERKQTAIKVADTITDAAGLQLNWFPYPHFEIVAMGRFQMPRGFASALTGLVFLHYFL